jgi:hypothetical protein
MPYMQGAILGCWAGGGASRGITWINFVFIYTDSLQAALHSL